MIEDLVKDLIKVHSNSFKADVLNQINLALYDDSNDHVTLDSDNPIEAACIDLVNSLVSYRFQQNVAKEAWAAGQALDFDPTDLMTKSIVAFHYFVVGALAGTLNQAD